VPSFLLSLWRSILSRWWRLTIPLRVRALGISADDSARYYGMPIISLVSGSSIHVGKAVVLCSDSRFTALGVSRPVVLRTTRAGASVRIGDNSGLSGSVICAAQSIIVGRDCLIGADVMIVDNDFHSIKADGRRGNNQEEDIAVSPVVIEDNVFIGARAIVLKGVRIGCNSVIGAGSVVVSSIPANCIAAGNPARVLRQIPASTRDVRS
jgi:acetyltransferase-like isoleucine patch superfamily enzyme